MTTFDIKLIAIITMIIDHIGVFFFPKILMFRLIGRLSFFLLAWLIANGAHYTHSFKKYLIRLFTLALVSQLPYFLANRQIDHSFWSLNAVFTLFLGLLAIGLINKNKNKLIWLIISLGCAGVAELIKADFGAIGVSTIIAFYLFFDNLKMMILSQLFISSLTLAPFLAYLFIPLPTNLNIADLVRPIGLLSLIFIAFYNHKEGPKAKYLFYLFYPLHFLLIYLMKIII